MPSRLVDQGRFPPSSERGSSTPPCCVGKLGQEVEEAEEISETPTEEGVPNELQCTPPSRANVENQLSEVSKNSYAFRCSALTLRL